jgi:hypothetical protein
MGGAIDGKGAWLLFESGILIGFSAGATRPSGWSTTKYPIKNGA